MSNTIRRFSEEFHRHENVRNDEQFNLVDPISIQAVFHDEAQNVYIDAEVHRASLGRYFFDVDCAELQTGMSYSISWRYEPIPDVIQIKRHDFIWRQEVQSVDGYCELHGDILDLVGIPVKNKTITIVQYDDFVVKNRITSQLKTSSDANGHWSFLAEWGQVYQAIIDNKEKKTFVVPDAHYVDYDSLDVFQYDSMRTDKFGNVL